MKLKKVLAIVAAAVLIFSLAACGSNATGTASSEAMTESSSSSESTASVSSEAASTAVSADADAPFIEFSSLIEAETQAGFDYALPQTFDNCPDITYYGKNATAIRAEYCRSGSNEISYIAEKAVSGKNVLALEYSEYTETDTGTGNSKDLTTYGKDGTVYILMWNDGGYDYALYNSSGFITQDEIETAVASFDESE
ncbi:MAG: hypothetical protein ACOX6J_06145 [Oscillospiraceae bacterium]|jgi:hypothetical protein